MQLYRTAATLRRSHSAGGVWLDLLGCVELQLLLRPESPERDREIGQHAVVLRKIVDSLPTFQLADEIADDRLDGFVAIVRQLVICSTAWRCDPSSGKYSHCEAELAHRQSEQWKAIFRVVFRDDKGERLARIVEAGQRQFVANDHLSDWL
jgi:hypothetical protein